MHPTSVSHTGASLPFGRCARASKTEAQARPRQFSGRYALLCSALSAFSCKLGKSLPKLLWCQTASLARRRAMLSTRWFCCVLHQQSGLAGEFGNGSQITPIKPRSPLVVDCRGNAASRCREEHRGKKSERSHSESTVEIYKAMVSIIVAETKRWYSAIGCFHVFGSCGCRMALDLLLQSCDLNASQRRCHHCTDLCDC